jgi:hypothetical protein
MSAPQDAEGWLLAAAQVEYWKCGAGPEITGTIYLESMG